MDDLAIISRVLEEHRAIKGHIKLVGDSISDQEALASLTQARADWIPGQQEILAEKQKKLQRALSFLYEGLKKHFSFEEELLPPLLGELLMRALILKHMEIIKQISEVKPIVADIKLEGLSRDELLSEESFIQRAINKTCQLVEYHTEEEEVILEMVERALREK